MPRLSPRTTRFRLRNFLGVDSNARRQRQHRARLEFQTEMLEERALLSASTVSSASTLTVGPSGEYSTISAAVAAAAPGDTIKVAPGVYNEEVRVNKPLTILGAQVGKDARSGHVPAGKESVVEGAGGDSAFLVMANDVTISGFTVQGTTNDLSSGAGIVLVQNTSGSKILDDIIQDNVAGLFLANNSSTDPTVISNDLFQNNNVPGAASGNGIYTDQFVSGGNLTNVVIDSNAFVNNQNGAVTLAASVQGDQSNITISNNSSSQDGDLAAVFDATNVQIASNKVTGSIGASIFVGGGSSAVNIVSNTLTNGASDGIAFDANPALYGGTSLVQEQGISVSLNKIKGFQGSGIFVAPNTMTSSAFFSNSSMKNAQDGIFIGAGNSGNVIVLNTFQNNAIYDAQDASTGNGTDGTANYWFSNHGKKSSSSPSGLLS